VRVFVLFLIILIDAVLQGTLLQGIGILGIVPNISIALVATYALLRDDVEGAIFGLCLGFVKDVLHSDILGYYSLMFLVAGYLCGKSRRSFYRENYISALAIIALTAFLYETAFYITGFLLRGNALFLHYLTHIILPTVLYTTLVSVIIYFLMCRINNLLEGRLRHRKIRRSPTFHKKQAFYKK